VQLVTAAEPLPETTQLPQSTWLWPSPKALLPIPVKVTL